METARTVDAKTVAEARDTIDAARTMGLRQFPYFSSALLALRPFSQPGLGTFGVDARSRMAFDPITALVWGVLYCCVVVLHEALHILFNHHARRGGREDMLRWNYACDCEINRVLLAAGLKFAPGFTPVTAEGMGLPPNLTAEEYYDLLTPEQTQKRRQQAQAEADAAAGTDPGTSKPMPGCGGDCGSAAGNPQGWEETADAESGVDGQTESDQRTMRQEVAQKVREYVAANGCGSVPAGLEIWSTVELTPPVVKWTSVLASMVRNAVASRSGADDYNLGRISRRSIGLHGTLGRRTPILPALRAPQPSVAVVLDTSGSMDGAPVRKGASEVYGVVRALGLPVKAYAVDAAVQIAVSIWTKADVTKLGKGGGGTDMALGIQTAAKGRPDVIVVISDAGTLWPAKCDLPKAKLIVVVIGSNEAAASVPGYMGARVIRVPVEAR